MGRAAPHHTQGHAAVPLRTGQRLELHCQVSKESNEEGGVEKKSGMIMAWLMGWGTHKEKRNLGIAKYYAACSSSMTIESNLKS